MMANDEFTKQFTAITETAQGFTNIALVGNVFINILLSGAMTFLWGLLHCMQIVAHFDLVNNMMPANAHQFFKILVSIATLDLLLSDVVIEEIENGIGVTNDDFALTKSFVDF